MILSKKNLLLLQLWNLPADGGQRQQHHPDHKHHHELLMLLDLPYGQRHLPGGHYRPQSTSPHGHRPGPGGLPSARQFA